jgi:hypothetical protein
MQPERKLNIGGIFCHGRGFEVQYPQMASCRAMDEPIVRR